MIQSQFGKSDCQRAQINETGKYPATTLFGSSSKHNKLVFFYALSLTHTYRQSLLCDCIVSNEVTSLLMTPQMSFHNCWFITMLLKTGTGRWVNIWVVYSHECLFILFTQLHISISDRLQFKSRKRLRFPGLEHQFHNRLGMRVD